jgi:hypothetical protein
MEKLLPFAGGSGYLLTHDLVQYLISQMDYLQPFYNEDVSVGTWLFPVRHTKYHNDNILFTWDKCKDKAMFIHPSKPKHMAQFYENTMSEDACFCDNVSFKMN